MDAAPFIESARVVAGSPGITTCTEFSGYRYALDPIAVRPPRFHNWTPVQPMIRRRTFPNGMSGFGSPIGAAPPSEQAPRVPNVFDSPCGHADILKWNTVRTATVRAQDALERRGNTWKDGKQETRPNRVPWEVSTHWCTKWKSISHNSRYLTVVGRVSGNIDIRLSYLF